MDEQIGKSGWGTLDWVSFCGAKATFTAVNVIPHARAIPAVERNLLNRRNNNNNNNNKLVELAPYFDAKRIKVS